MANSVTSFVMSNKNAHDNHSCVYIVKSSKNGAEG